MTVLENVTCGQCHTSSTVEGAGHYSHELVPGADAGCEDFVCPACGFAFTLVLLTVPTSVLSDRRGLRLLRRR